MDKDILDEDVMARVAEADHSPCVGHCTNDADDFCLSCRRHIDEITTWRDGKKEMRRGAWARIPKEIDKAGVKVMRLPLSPDDISALALKCLDEGGRWATGGGDQWVYADDLIADKDGVLKAVSDDGGCDITLDLSGKMRALAWSRDEAEKGRGKRHLAEGLDRLPILIVVPRARIKDRPNHVPTIREDGMTDLGVGLASLTVLKDGDDLIFKTLLAEGRIRNAPHHKTLGAEALKTPLPAGLKLPESYVLAAVILPKGEEAL